MSGQMWRTKNNNLVTQPFYYYFYKTNGGVVIEIEFKSVFFIIFQNNLSAPNVS
jgi:hypothetical protein